MLIVDRIYGKTEVNDPVIRQIIKSASFKRLKGISQFGPPDEFYHLKNFYRDEHCLGVMILLKVLGASREEQIAGLLHDISHTAFSHVIDWVIGDSKNESFQDNKHSQFLEKSEIPGILNKYQIDSNKISDYHNFKLLERDIPDLCADRIDYSLREFPVNIAKKCFKELNVKQNMIVFNDQETAHLFAGNFLKLQTNHWGGMEAISRYRILGNVLKDALNKGVLEIDDFWKDDQFVVKKLKKSIDPEIKKILKILNKKSFKNLPKGNEKVYKKFRHVDPCFLERNKLVRLSEVNKKFAKELKFAKEKNKEGILMPIV